MKNKSKKAPQAKEIIEAIKELEKKDGNLVPISELKKVVQMDEKDLMDALKSWKNDILLIYERKPNSFVRLNPKYIEMGKDEILGERIIVKVKQPNTEQQSYLWCDKIEYVHDHDQFPRGYFDHHLMIWKNRDLVFKVWLPNEDNDKEFKDVHEALKSVGMEVNE